VRRWLAAPLQSGDGTLVERDTGTPQGSAVSPVVANLFMHFAFDNWLAKRFPACPFERYADDALVHCANRRQAEAVLPPSPSGCKRWASSSTRTKRGSSIAKTPSAGGTMSTLRSPSSGSPSGPGRPGTGGTGGCLTPSPAMSNEALKAKGAELRAMRIHRRTAMTLDDLADWLIPIVRGWMNYYGRFYRTQMIPSSGVSAPT
jgi:RNA-directed DNA polymerase